MEVWFDDCALQNWVASDAYFLWKNSTSKTSIDVNLREYEASTYKAPQRPLLFVATVTKMIWGVVTPVTPP